MKGQEQKVCDVCHERPATHHTCNGSTGVTKDLCITCFERTASPVELDCLRNFDQLIRRGKCKYCGEPAVGGCGGLTIPEVIEQPLDIWCEACRLDLCEFNRQPENKIPDFPFDDEPAQARISEQLAERERRQEEFMRRKIRERSR